MSEGSEEMKSPIIEKSKMGQEDDNELLVKGESPVVDTYSGVYWMNTLGFLQSMERSELNKIHFIL